jgi:hypothetical protein
VQKKFIVNFNNGPTKLIGSNFIVALSLACGLVVGVAAAFINTQADSSLTSANPRAMRPSKTLEPEDVVRVQLNALRLAEVEPESFEDCYVFASPENKQAFPQLEQFRDMLVRSYKGLIGHRQAVVGRAIIDGNFARVLVTGFDASQRVMCYEFFLAKQGYQPYLDCWMTDSVFQVVSLDIPTHGTTPIASNLSNDSHFAVRK